MVQNIDEKYGFSCGFFIETCKRFPKRKFFTFQESKEDFKLLVGEDLLRSVAKLGSVLQNRLNNQEKALILLPQGLEYIQSLLSCLYANVIAIPISITDISQQDQILNKIKPVLEDSQATCILTNQYFKEFLTSKVELPETVSVLDVEATLCDKIEIIKARLQPDDDIALLLYTSGSTSQPKGVITTHANLLSQARTGARQWSVNEQSTIVSWMPQFHNFGLNFNILAPLVSGATSVILSPGSFIADPEGWFESISRHQATHTAAPNFAFDYCCATIDPNSMGETTLESLAAIVCGGEPIRKETWQNFTGKFRTMGLRDNLFSPHYGLSETGSVTSVKPGTPLRFLSLEISELEQGIIKETTNKTKHKSVTSCGEIEEGVTVLAVNPETLMPCESNEVGEIWVQSQSVAKGYLNRSEETKSTFSGVLKDSEAGNFLRTGDLGFIDDNQLYIVGREKEVIIIHGKNHHPVDIEWTIQKNIPDLTLPLALFSFEKEHQEKVVVVQEVDPSTNEQQHKEIVRKIISAVSENHGIELYEINLVEKGVIPKTGSGKIQRKACKNVYMEGKLASCYQYKQRQPQAEESENSEEETINRTLLAKLKKSVFQPVLNIDSKIIDNAETIGELGLNSIQYAQIARGIEDLFQIHFAPVLLFKYRGFEQLVSHIASILGNSVNNLLKPEKETIESTGKEESEKVPTSKRENGADVAIIGMSCCFPGESDTPERFWENMINQKDSITSIRESRPWMLDDDHGYYGKQGDIFPQWGGFINDPDTFDADFFGISPLEAESMDPQQRKLMELTWNVIEHAGYNPNKLAGQNIGLFIGAHNNDYSELITRDAAYMDTYGAYLDSGLHMSLITHRISRWFNFHGPSEMVNTACSSSLVAIHHAVEAIQSGECGQAIAGGINLILTSRIYLASHRAGMLSEDGRCKTFDQSANGFVRAEGYGAVLLKPLNQAIRNGDAIHGIVKAAVINHDGKSNSLRAPNPNAQRELIENAYIKASLLPETTTYIEAHGTGTSLGDPIEIQALQEAFQELDSNLPASFCGIGTVKTNIGHCESAAGIAGVIKVLLAMKHQVLPGILHFNELNSYISLEKSPFRIVENNQSWERLASTTGEKIPLRAGVSSFGFGGANGHIILEEFIPSEIEHYAPATIYKRKEVLVPFSAKNMDRLRTIIKQFLLFLNEQEKINLLELAYTLQTGREAMEERLLFQVADLPELIQKLEVFDMGDISPEICLHGSIQREEEHRNKLNRKKEDINELRSWAVRGELNKIADLWIQGSTIDWNLLYGSAKPKRVGLPVYAFAKDRYWIRKGEKKSRPSIEETSCGIHPLIHQNSSNLEEQRFSSHFTGEEFFLKDHQIQGKKVLPGAATLEMARTAIELSTVVPSEEETGIQLKNVVWVRPIVAEEEKTNLHIGLFPEQDGEIAWEIYGDDKEEDIEPIVYTQGNALIKTMDEAPVLDLPLLQSRCTEICLTSEQCYEVFESMGIIYGPGHRGIDAVYAGNRQLLAQLSLPHTISETLNDFQLHPSLIDSAFQASIGFMIGYDPLKAVLPFAVESLEIYGSCDRKMWGLIRSCNDGDSGKSTQKLDIDLCDENGVVAVRIKGFSTRIAYRESIADQAKKKGAKTIGTLPLRPHWVEKNIVSNEEPAVSYDQQLVIFCEFDGIYPKQIEALWDGVRCINLRSAQKNIDKRFRQYLTIAFEEIQTMIRERIENRTLIQIVVPSEGEQQLFSGLSGLIKTARLENPNLIGQIISLTPPIDSQALTEMVEILKENGNSPADQWIQYRDHRRWLADWEEIKEEETTTDPPWKDHGVYLITGGMGSLGLLFAKEVVRKAEAITLILTGRSPLDQKKEKQLQALRATGAKVEFQLVDVSKKRTVQQLLLNIQERFGKLNGIIHSAGVIRDSLILKKSIEELQEVMAPKVSGIVNLDEASENMNLDFFAFFSSIAGSLGNPGQIGYSGANAFMDCYAKYRNALVKKGERKGQTLSINWPLWKEGGMRVDTDTENIMRQNMGMIAMKTESGMNAFYKALNSGLDQVMVIEGELERLHMTFFKTERKQLKEVEKSDVPNVSEQDFTERAINYFKRLLSSEIKRPVDKIEADAPMEKYGIDSVMVMRLTNQLEKVFGSLSKTLFFEYQNLRALSGYFIKFHKERLIELIGMKNRAVVTTEPEDTSSKTVNSTGVISKRLRRPRFAAVTASKEEKREKGPLNIAIVGLSGRYPQAKNIREFWNNLQSGKDSITEIPKNRWDYSLYFDEEKNVQGKTYAKWGGFIDGVDLFDPLFFNIAPQEAEMMPPQERLFLECVYETIEDAGYTRDALAKYQRSNLDGDVGVYVGVMYNEYQLYGSQETIQGRAIALSGVAASIANRVSWFYNFHGPCMTVDTMCSSSLTVTHLACQSLLKEECKVAIVGGVNLSIHPNKFLLLAQGRFASSKGRCESFGKGGDGYVPGEGIGAMMLKPIDQAVADRDHIYGVIQGSAINHGGKNNGYTVPNPNAQAAVIGEALKNSGINPETFSYLEAHGTGTSLGDPIEIAGLSKAFGEFTDKKQFCAIGSVKSNIGHCESAAGIAGITKVLLQLQYKKLLPSLHSKILNPNIDFTKTPFVVQQELVDWKRPIVAINGENREFPRTAGISAFGAGGSNAHVIIEEYISKEPESTPIEISSQNPGIILLSARTERQLRQQAERLLNAIEIQQFSDNNLADIAYTLQVGREVMEERLAVIIRSIEDLQEKLNAFLDGQDGIDELYQGDIKKEKKTIELFANEEDLQEVITKWSQQKRYSKILELWVKGLSFDWETLYTDKKPKRIALPSYPFANERYWIPETETNPTLARLLGNSIGRGITHPLLHQNTSSLSEQRFSATFSGKEFFLSDHIINGEKVIPGAATLEMARAAVELSLDNPATGNSAMLIKDVRWIQPAIIQEETGSIHIGLFAEDDGEVSWEIYSNQNDDRRIYAQGIAQPVTIDNIPTLDLQYLRSTCKEKVLANEHCYEAFKRTGLEYGPTHRGVEVIYGGLNQLLAKLTLTQSVFDTGGEFVLHPGLIDSAFQSTIGFMIRFGNLEEALPVGLEEIEVFGPASSSMWAHVREIKGNADKWENRAKETLYNIDLCDDQGKICARIKGFSMRMLKKPENTQAFLIRIAAEILNVKIDAIDVHASFEEHGFDPIRLNQLMERMNREYGLSLTSSILVDFPTLYTFVEHLVEQYGQLGQDPDGVSTAHEKKDEAQREQELVNNEESVVEESIRERSEFYFKKLLSSVIKLPPNRIDSDDSMEKFGIDSVMAMRMTDQLEKVFGTLSKTLFFEYHTIRALTTHFLELHHEKMVDLLKIETKTKTVAKKGAIPEKPITMEPAQHRFGSRSQRKRTTEYSDIAVIGLSGRYPKANTIQEFWNNLRDGKDCITEIPKERWNHNLYFDENKNNFNKTYSKWGGFIDGVDLFDPLFFHITPSEAETIDPQERLFLQCAYETMEDAGYTREMLSGCQDSELKGDVGVYVGVMYEEYQLYGAQRTAQGWSMALSVNPSSIANRVSWFSNFNGPCMAVDTMCSSSLTTIHLACKSLQQNECEVAIAGGVNISIHPNKYLGLGQRNFVSSKGKCESFGQGGDGYVPGEGVGAVLLKPKVKAVADKDNIYGIIKGSAINHGGKTNGFTVPNPNSQGDVIIRAFENAGINPRSISYIEAHGTGTSLGDPIEIAGLNKAFRRYTSEKQFCAIGSAKSNIGHCESAAGIAGLTKILLQFKHRQLLPSLHSAVLNPNIDFEESPFVVQQELDEWKQPVIEINGKQKKFPRIAGISAFGAGGSNAHVILEEYIPSESVEEQPTPSELTQAIVILSAKNKKELREQAIRLINAIKEQKLSDSNLIDMAYTLQVGREAMEARLAILVNTIGDLIDKLQEFVDGKNGIVDLYHGHIKENGNSLTSLARDEDMEKTIEAWIAKGKYEKLPDLWVKGLNINWNKLYGDYKPYRMHLPTYPFNGERYWPSDIENVEVLNNAGGIQPIHPLLHQNNSNFARQIYSSTFTGQEFFLANHVVNKQRVLPGVAYLEMARTAVDQSIGTPEKRDVQIRLENIVWSRPIIVQNESLNVHIGLTPKKNGHIAWEVHSTSNSGIETIVHSQGWAILTSAVERPTMNLPVLQAQCGESSMNAAEFYETFKMMGFDYGPEHQGIEMIHMGAKRILAKLTLPPSLSDTVDQYVLHPALMDSALQASLGFAIESKNFRAVLPFAIEQIEIYDRCTTAMWVFIQYCEGCKAEDAVQKLDIDISDNNGKIAVRMKGVTSRFMEVAQEKSDSATPLPTKEKERIPAPEEPREMEEIRAIKELEEVEDFEQIEPVERNEEPAETKEFELLSMQPCWKNSEAKTGQIGTDHFDQHLVILCELEGVETAKIENQLPGTHCLTLDSKEQDIAKRFQIYAAQLFETIQKLFNNKKAANFFIQILFPALDEKMLFAGLAGMLKTAQLENPKLKGQLIGIQPANEGQGIEEEIPRIVRENLQSSEEPQVQYQAGKRLVVDWNEMKLPENEVDIPWKDQGIYLITGGAGGLGLLFAKEIALQVENPTLILTGRSTLNEEKEIQLEKLRLLGASVEYKAVDVTQQEAVDTLIREICETYGSLNGIIHSAGVVRDNFLIRKSSDELREVLAPKVSGLVNLDEATKDLPLDIFVLFSSIAGAIGNPGQADYSTGNAFMDTYAAYRNSLVATNQRRGKTLSINWPLWKEGGMQIGEPFEKIMTQNTGMIAMRTDSGINALYQSLAFGESQVLVMEGILSKMKETMF